MSSTDPIRVIHSSKSNLELIHSANTVNCRSAPTIKLSHISSARYQPRATRIHRTRRQPIYYENSWKQGISQLKKIPRLLSSPYHHRITPISQRKFVPVDTSMHFDTQITKAQHQRQVRALLQRRVRVLHRRQVQARLVPLRVHQRLRQKLRLQQQVRVTVKNHVFFYEFIIVTTCYTGNSFSSTPLFSTSGTSPSYWTEYSFNYVAATTTPILIFSFTTDLNSNYFLGDVSVTLISSPSIQLLANPNFDNSTTIATDWLVWCAYTCTGGAGAQVTWGTNCYLSIGNCFLVDCPDTGSGAIVYLGQSFSATIGSTYKIDFWLRIAYGGGSTSSTLFHAFVQ
ncbi:unnamed protein product [Rotaria magnacalcarata]|uniref:Uncharacterized protein n=1 Tax=Rotaria magnacalcarata TaxID=392030 RepID=A0A816S2C6_9BILA|nr:unnamed protein product [Rotaria magnacalcarata]